MCLLEAWCSVEEGAGWRRERGGGRRREEGAWRREGEKHSWREKVSDTEKDG